MVGWLFFPRIFLNFSVRMAVLVTLEVIVVLENVPKTDVKRRILLHYLSSYSLYLESYSYDLYLETALSDE